MQKCNCYIENKSVQRCNWKNNDLTMRSKHCMEISSLALKRNPPSRWHLQPCFFKFMNCTHHIFLDIYARRTKNNLRRYTRYEQFIDISSFDKKNVYLVDLLFATASLASTTGENPNSLGNIYSQDIPKGRPGTFQQDVQGHSNRMSCNVLFLHFHLIFVAPMHIYEQYIYVRQLWLYNMLVITL